MNNMEHMQYFTWGLKVQIRMFLNTSTGGAMKIKDEDEVREMIERMCQNEYRTQSEIGPKKKGMMELDTQHDILPRLEALTKQLVITSLA